MISVAFISNFVSNVNIYFCRYAYVNTSPICFKQIVDPFDI